MSGNAGLQLAWRIRVNSAIEAQQVKVRKRREVESPTRRDEKRQNNEKQKKLTTIRTIREQLPPRVNKSCASR